MAAAGEGAPAAVNVFSAKEAHVLQDDLLLLLPALFAILAAAFLFCSPIQLLLIRYFPIPPGGQERARGLSGVAKQFISRFGLGGVEEVVVVVDREIEVVRHRCEARHPQKEIFDDFAECGGSMFGDEGGGAGGGGDAPSTAMV
jgi:hypothetical protein